MIGLPYNYQQWPTLNKAGSGNTTTNNLANQLNATQYGSIGALGKFDLANKGILNQQSANDYWLSQSNANADKPVQSANGQWVSSTTGKPWHGSYQNPNGSTQYFSNGKSVSDIGQVGNEMPNISVQQLQKNPAISGQVADVANANAAGTKALSKSFSDYLAEANKVNAQSATQLAKDQAAIDPTATIARMNDTAASGTAGANAAVAGLAANQQAVLGGLTGANQNYQATQDAAFKAFQDKQAADLANYNAASQAETAAAISKGLQGVHTGQLVSGNVNNSGAVDSRAESIAAQLAYQRALDIAGRTASNTANQYNIGSNLQNAYLGNLTNQYGVQGQQGNTLYGAQTAANAYTTGLNQDTAKYIQNLQQATAGMSRAMAAQYLQQLGVPIQLAQSILAGNVSNLQALTNLDQTANQYNYVGQYQPNYPGAPTPSLYLPPSGNNTGTANNYSGGSLLQNSGQLPSQADYVGGFKPTAIPNNYASYPIAGTGGEYQRNQLNGQVQYGPNSYYQGSPVYTQAQRDAMERQFT